MAFLRDLSPIPGANSSSAGGKTNIMPILDGYLQHSQNDLEILADFEEEQSRRGHYSLIFPLSNNIDSYRLYFSQQRRSNLVLWSYIKKGCPVKKLIGLLK